MSSKPSILPELNVETLSGLMPTQYRRWLRVGIATVIVGYAIAWLSLAYEGRLGAFWTMREPYVIACGLLAFWCERTGRLRGAAMLVLGAVWIELHITLLEEGVRSIGTSVFAAVIVGVAICLGRRTALVTAASSLLTIPLALALGWTFERAPARSSGDLAAVVVLLVSVLGTVLLLHLFMDAFSRVLLQSESNRARARELTDDAPDVIIALSDRGTVEDMNPAAERVLQVSRNQAIGRPFEALPLTAVDDELVAHGRKRSGEMPRVWQVSATSVTLEGLFRSVTRADGTAGFLVWLRDVTARNRAEAQAAALREQLQHSQRLEALGRLAGGVAHDFNNLLTTVGGYADLIARHSDAKIREVSGELSSIRERGKSLTRQLLAFARKEKASPQLVDLHEAISAMEGLLARLLAERFQLQLDLEPGSDVVIDLGQLQQLVLNLVVNAKDAMVDGGTVKVRCRARRETGRVELEIEDSGVGMDADTKRRAFEPFFTTKPRGKGTGLGLSLVHGIVEASEGRIDVTSTPGQGTTLTISWPHHRAAERRSRPTIPPLSRVARRGTLLVAEDDPEGRRLLTQLLEDAGYAVLPAANGRDALRLFNAHASSGKSIDLLLSDVRMPVMNGPELARELSSIVPELPVLFVSGYYDAELDGAGVPPGGDVVAKPYTTNELLSRIERAMARRWQASVLRA